jgi:aminopeptidase-like protein
VSPTAAAPTAERTGEEMHELVRRLYPICRSLTGDGVRETLSILSEWIPLKLHEVPTGTSVLDWTVPKEWNIRDAYIKGPGGDKVVDFRESNLHVLGYSVPLHERMSLEQLRPHLFSVPEHPDWIPYRTSYYEENWGFCLSHRVLESMEDGEYEVCIDSSLEDGHLTYGELSLPGESDEEVLLYAHVCHPSLCNDNLAALAIATVVGRHLASAPRRYSYRIIFAPGTIGSITWLARNEDRLGRIRHGLVLACFGDPGDFTYKQSRQVDAEIDRAAAHVLARLDTGHEVRPFTPYGYDERQFCSPGFDLAVGCLMRTPYGEFPEYHSSADDPSLVTPGALADSYSALLEILDLLERNRVFRNLSPKGEPQLGRRGLYGSIGGAADGRSRELALLWVLNLSDGHHSLLDVAERSGLPFNEVSEAADALVDHDLLTEVS